MVDKKQILYMRHLQVVAELFDDYADTFDEHLLNGLRYDVPKLMREQVPLERKFKRCLDLGCGTGLAGVVFRESCDYLEGVDLSLQMVKKTRARRQEVTEEGNEGKDGDASCRRRKIYDKAAQGDLVHHLRKQSDKSFDLLVSADTVMYLFDLELLFKEAKRVLSAEGLFVFSTESATEDEIEEGSVGIIEREETERFAYTRKYVVDMATKNEFFLESVVNVRTRNESDYVIRGDIFVFVRTDA
mmetsp:Transcript_3476/g.4161  ORF Transcript_3476/g.4161 Transcript_3476/m.4161 type:complete len:244 (+) Transcript_3476:28-759(+)|eukprot:CAMPEP_0195293220 /NCGR_PEP_ID=MMETSP0707-20130614/12004_1 /TAXON_ID=33640 /ORGANISM="Asterionellopsis glacialis, Strain CCMP134" /LENGTH=243 /DNA_ID=CAMNT_0040353885 /DNA_START=8 /DNA_END=739 /DNA_ORIENTATION=+